MNQSPAYNAGHSVGTIVAYIVIYGCILAFGVYFGKSLSRKRDDGVVVRWPGGAAVTLILLLLIGQFSTANKAQSASISGGSDIVIQQRVYGPASNFPTDFNAEFVRIFDKGMRDGIAEAINSKDPSISLNAITISTIIVDFSWRKVIRTKAQVPSRMFLYQFAGTVGKNMVLVVCMSRTAEPFDTAGTECERSAAKLFGV